MVARVSRFNFYLQRFQFSGENTLKHGHRTGLLGVHALACRGLSKALVSLLFAALCVLTGCLGPEHARKRQATKLSVFLETSPRSGSHSQKISVFRNNPIQLTVENKPFLTEAFVSQANVITVMDGFAISIQFERRGTLLLEQYSAGNRGRRFAIQAEFGKNLAETRFLAAPLIQSRIANGVLTFTPDCTREEADQIVLGLNNVAKKVQEKSEW